MANLLVFHQGSGQSGRLWCNALQDQIWQGDVQPPNTNMTASPSAVEFKGKVYCFHQGYHESGELWCNVYDGLRWQGDFMPIGPGAHLSYSPSVVVFKNRIYCFFQGANKDGRLYALSSPDGANWTIERNGEPARDTYLTHSPAAVAFNEAIYVFHQGRDSGGNPNGVIWYNIYNGSDWRGDQKVPNTPGMSVSCSAAVYQGKLYVFHQGHGEDGSLHCSILDGSGWAADAEVLGEKSMLSSPSAVVLDDRLYCFYQGPSEDGSLCYSSLFNGTWEAKKKVSETGMSAAPGAMVTTLPPPPAAVVAPDPKEVRVASFDGWGTSLCWWANQYGGEPGKFGASYLADLIFGSGTVMDPKGNQLPSLAMNIVRYNIGGGGGGAKGEAISLGNPVQGPPFHYIQGFWKKPGDGDKDPNNTEYWDWSVDTNQRKMLSLARERGANKFEFFSNSPPWWMCNNHSSSGGDVLHPLTGNLPKENVDKFARYLVTVVKRARETWNLDGPSVEWSVEPFNEPDPPAWFIARPTSVDIPPQITWSVQEGCNFLSDDQTGLAGGALQQDVIRALHMALNDAGLQGKVTLTASDWNSIDYAIDNWDYLKKSDSDFNLKFIEKVNVHGYYGRLDPIPVGGTDPYRGPNRAKFRDSIRQWGDNVKQNVKLWMSEYGDGDHSGMTMALSIMLDLTELQPSAWVLWQSVDPNWSLFNPGNGGQAVGDPFASYYAFAQFSRHVRQGCRIIGDGTVISEFDDNTLHNFKSIVAYDTSSRKLVIVTLNLDRARWVTYDLSHLSTVNGPVQRWETTANANEAGGKKYKLSKDVTLNEKKFRFHCGLNSVNTFEIQDVTL